MRIRVLLLLVCVAVGHAQQPAPEPQQPPVVFRAEINYVEVDATVTDQKGVAVSNLAQSDFEVLEDGKPQKISTFALVNIPISQSDRPILGAGPVEPDVATNDHVDGRIYMIVLDSLHTEPLMALRVKTAAKTFIERRMGTNDLAAVVHTGGRSDWGQDFTNNRRLLMAAIDRFVGERLTSTTLLRTEALNRGDPTFPTNPVNSTRQNALDPEEMQRGNYAQRTLGTVKKLADFLSGIRGRRKALVFISEGLPYNLADPWSTINTSMVLDEVRDAIGAATRGNVSIYAIDPRGLTTGDSDAILVDGFPRDQSFGVGMSSLLTEVRMSQDSLRILAEETGGFAAVNRNDFKDVFERVVKENSTYYVLGYYPTNDKRDGKFRKITVRVKPPGLQVRARRGYAAPRGKVPEPKPSTLDVSPTLREAINSPLPVVGIPMRVFAGAFKATAPNAAVAIAAEMQTSTFTFVEKGETVTDRVDVVVTPIDQTGNVRPVKRARATLTLKPDGLKAAQTYGVRVLTSVELPPGRYQLRVSAGEENANRVGSVLVDVEVPDFSKGPFTMSGVALTALSAPRMVTVGSEGLIAPLMPGPTVARREFTRDDTLALFAEFYENMPGAPSHTIELSVSVKSSDGRVVFESREERSSKELQAGRGGFGYTPQIPLKDIVPGTYVVHVEGKARTSEGHGIGRDIVITVK